MLAHVLGEHHGFAALAHQLVNHAQHGGSILQLQRVHEAEEEGSVRRAQHAAHQGFIHVVAVSQAHIEDGQRVAHAAFRRTGNHVQGIVRCRGACALHRLAQPSGDLMGRNAPEIKALAAAEDRRGEPLGFGGGEDKANMGRGLFQRFQQRVKRRGRQHVHLVDDVDLVFPLLGRILHRLPQVADFIHAIVRGRVDFHHVHGFLRQQTAAGFALPAWVAVDGRLAVDGAGHDFRRGGLARASAAAEQVRMGDAPGHDLVAERRHNGLLGDHR